MDDIWVFGHDAGKLRVVQLELQDALRELGLEMNHAKTEVLEGDDVVSEVLQVQHSAIEDALLDENPDSQPLIELIEAIIGLDVKADRTSIKFATKRMREHKIFGQVDDLVEAAPTMPHGADALARLFRDSRKWRELPHWYVDHANSPWGTIRWSIAQLGTAFPSKLPSGVTHKDLEPVRDFFVQVLDTEAPLPLVSLAAQRLAAWDKKESRSVLRAAASGSADPHIRRVLALAATSAGEERAVVRSMLNEFEENLPTLRMLEQRRFRVAANPDFAA